MLAFCIILIPFFCIGNPIDSLHAIIRCCKYEGGCKKDTTYINTLNALSAEFLDVAPDSTFTYASHALQLSIKLRFAKGQAEALWRIGNVYFLKEDFYKAIINYQKAIQRAEEIKHTACLALVSYNLGQCYYAIGLYSLSIKFSSYGIMYFKSLLQSGMNQNKNQRWLVHAYNSLAQAYERKGYYKKSIAYFQLSLNLSDSLRYSNGITLNLNNLGNVYSAAKEYEQARKFILRSLALSQRDTNQYMVAHNLAALGRVYRCEGRTDSAFLVTRRAFTLSKLIGDRKSQSQFSNQLAMLFADQGKTDSSLYFARLSFTWATKAGLKAERINSAKLLTEMFSKIGAYRNAFVFQGIVNDYTDSLFDHEAQMSIVQQEMEQEYDRNRKQSEVNDLENQVLREGEEHLNQIVRNTTIVALFLLLVFIFLVQRSRQKLAIANTSIKAAYHKIEESQAELMKQNLELKLQQEEIKTLNNNLEAMVEERTLRLKQRNDQLRKYAFFNAHKMRSPIATILGLYNLLKLCQSEYEKLEVYLKIKGSIEELEHMSRISQVMLDENYIGMPEDSSDDSNASG